MPAAVGIIPTFLTLSAAAFGASGFTQFLIYAGSSLIANNALMKDMTEQTRPPRGVEIQGNTASTSVPLPLVYGQVKIGGNDVYRHVSTSGYTKSYLWIVQTLAEGECEGIATDSNGAMIYINGQRMQDFEDEHGNVVSYWFHSGSRTQTYDTNLNAVDSNWTDNMQNTCYIVWRLKYDQDAFSSRPQLTVVLQGRKVWLPDGTKAYSNNCAAILYDYLKSPHCAFGLEHSGLDQLEVDEIDWKSYSDSYTYCNTKGWVFNGAIFEEVAGSVVSRMKRHFRGKLGWTDGMFRMGFKDLNYESSSMTLTDDHIMCDAEGKPQIGFTTAGKMEEADGLHISFVNDHDDNYMEDFIRLGEAGNVNDADLSGYSSRELAGKMGSYLLERMKDPYNRVIRGLFRHDCIQLEKGDVVTLTSTALGYTSQYMRVISKERTPFGSIRMELQLEHVDLYNDSYDVDIEGTYQCDIPTVDNFDPTSSPEKLVELTCPPYIFTLTLDDLNRVYVIDDNNDVTINLPDVGADDGGRWVKFIHYGTGKLTLQAASGDSIDESVAGGNIWHEEWA